VNEPKFSTEDQFIQNIRWMVDRAREGHIVPVVSTIQHVDAQRLMARHKASVYGVEGPNRKIDRYNAALRRLCVEQKVSLADFSNVLDEAGGPSPAISPDGVHLTAEGYRLLAATFFQVIARFPEAGDSIVCIGDSLTYGVPLRTADRNSDQTYPAQLERMLLRLRLAESRE
jgi:lysophospholipase L1-like esterase